MKRRQVPKQTRFTDIKRDRCGWHRAIPAGSNYLNEGDRLRYLPQFPLPFEKYDKSRDEEIPCLFCGRMNPVKNDNCTFCHNPMIK